MSKRHTDALAISNGACNPSGIAHSIVDAVREARDERTTVASDPAIRLMVFQLAFIMGFSEFSMKTTDGTDFFDWSDACRKASANKP